MQALLRFGRQGGGVTRGRGTNELYQPLDTGNAPVPWDDRSGGTHRCRRCCCDTQGKGFNILVGWVIFANAMFIAIETDTGLLGFDTPRWTGLETDMGILGVGRKQQSGAELELREGIQGDKVLKAELQQQYNETFNEEVDLLRSYPASKSGAYTVCEYLFVAFYVLELCTRLCDVGCRAYCRDAWKVLDITVIVFGILDLGLPMVLGPDPTSSARFLLSVLRVTRVLRVLRLFRVCHELRVLGGAYSKAFSAVMWVGVLILVLDFVLAVFLTSLIGQRAHLWEEKSEEVEHWFGSIGRSMQTLFAIMTLTGWDHIAMVLAEVIPAVIVMPSIILYILLCCFTMVSLVMGVVSDSFMTSQRDEEKLHASRVSKRCIAFAGSLSNALASSDQSRNGYITREGFKMALECDAKMSSKLKALDISTDVDELMQLFDRLRQDSASAELGVSIDSLVEAITFYSGTAKASSVFDLKYLLLAVRRETAQQAAETQDKGLVRHQEQTAAVKRAAGEVADTKQAVAAVQQDVAAVRREVAALHEKVESLKKQEEQERREGHEALAAVHAKLDSLAAQYAVQREVPDKIDELAAQVTAQAAVNQKADTFAAQFAAQFVAQFAAQFAAVGTGAVAGQVSSLGVGTKPAESPVKAGEHQSAERMLEPGCAERTPRRESTAASCAGQSTNSSAASRSPEKLEEPESTLRAEPESTVRAEPESTNRGQPPSRQPSEAESVLPLKPEGQPLPGPVGAVDVSTDASTALLSASSSEPGKASAS
mmetsp:Transcript_53190/g.170421  ORF Transcript_53190/g.170421 Transcript_53190/m.170421 type:complete len:768 (-) Transcript_53190:67-2370(-)